MEKKIFIALFITTHLFFIGFQIDKHSRLVKLSYAKQSYEQKLKVLAMQKQELINQIHSFQDHHKIKQFAKNELGMQPLFLKDIKHLPKQETPEHEGS